MTGHVSSAFPGAQDHRTRSSTVNKSPSESMSFITEVICKFIFTDVHMRNNCRPNRALVWKGIIDKHLLSRWGGACLKFKIIGVSQTHNVW